MGTTHHSSLTQVKNFGVAALSFSPFPTEDICILPAGPGTVFAASQPSLGAGRREAELIAYKEPLHSQQPKPGQRSVFNCSFTSDCGLGLDYKGT